MAFQLIKTSLLKLQHWGMSELTSEVLDGFNVGFTVVFLCECILKLLAFQPRHYFVDAWNVFDFLVVVGSILDIIVSEVRKN